MRLARLAASEAEKFMDSAFALAVGLASREEPRQFITPDKVGATTVNCPKSFLEPTQDRALVKVK
jgi:hypothetical protein